MARTALHAAAAALSGGCPGPAGAQAASVLMSQLASGLESQQAPKEATQALRGGGAELGPGNALNVEVNSRQLHPDERK